MSEEIFCNPKRFTKKSCKVGMRDEKGAPWRCANDSSNGADMCSMHIYLKNQGTPIKKIILGPADVTIAQPGIVPMLDLSKLQVVVPRERKSVPKRSLERSPIVSRSNSPRSPRDSPRRSSALRSPVNASPRKVTAFEELTKALTPGREWYEESPRSAATEDQEHEEKCMEKEYTPAQTEQPKEKKNAKKKKNKKGRK
jgi:hypothetical protein